MQHGLEIEDWAFWAPEGRDPTEWRRHWQHPNAEPVEARPPDDLLPSTHRRRMSTLSRLAVQVALAASRRAVPDFLVFASQHGELGRTRELLASIAAGAELSPASFSQSVHNTSAGLFTIAAKSQAPATSIAAGASTFAYGWIEAEAYLAANRDRRVLLVAYDEPLSPEYRAYTRQIPCMYGAAFLLKWAERGGVVLHDAEPGVDEPLPLAPLFAAWWASTEPTLTLTVDGRGWQWRRGGE